MPTIIISYRREDTELVVGRICDRLRDHYGPDRVIMDIDSIPYGLDFRKHIREALKRCDTMLAIIGPRWAATNEEDQPRLADETDWVRIEIEAALAKDIPVIPVLINGARMPKPRELPETMRDLAFRQATEVDLRRDFHAHMDRLIRVMDQLLAKANSDDGVVDAERVKAVPAQTEETPPGKPEATETKAVGAVNAPAMREQARIQNEIDAPVAKAQDSHEPKREAEVARYLLGSVIARNWRIFALRGLLGIVFGLICLLVPAAADLLVLVVLFSAYVLVDGMFAITSGVKTARNGARGGLYILEGIVDIAAGLVALLWPALTTVAFALIIAVWAILSGALMLAAAVSLNLDHGRWWLAICGIASLIFGIVFVIAPVVGDVRLAWLLGAYALVFGVLLLMLADQLHSRYGVREKMAPTGTKQA